MRANKYVFRLFIAMFFFLEILAILVISFNISTLLIAYSISYVIIMYFFFVKVGSIKRLISSLEVIYLTAYSIYAIMPPIQYLLDNGKQRLEFFLISYEGIRCSFTWYLLTFLVLSILLLLFNYPKSSKYETIIKNTLIDSQKKRINILFDFIAMICLLLFAYSMIRNGISFFLSDFINRRSLSDFSLRQYVWVYMMVYSVEIMCECAFNKDLLKNKRRLLQISFIVIFWVLSLFVDRRHIIPVVLALILYHIFMNKKLELKYILLILFFSWAMVMYALFRTQVSTGSTDLNTTIYDGLAEFILTGYISVYYATHPLSSFYFGRTYIWDTITRIFPKFIFPWKPADLAITFMSTVLHNRVGFAFNPIVEGYFNFGNYLVIFVPIIILTFIKMGYRLTKKEPLFYFVFCAYSLDFCRGQFANCIFDILLMYIIMRLMKKVRLCNE